MIEFIAGDIFEAHAEALVNAVNCVGIMGRGLALQFKKAFPDNFRAYVAACGRGEVQPGRMFVFETDRPNHPKYVINFPTKRHWKSKSRMEDVEAGLVALRGEIEQRSIGSIAVPALGAGPGGLPWQAVRQGIEAILSGLVETQVTVFEPLGGSVATSRLRARARSSRG